MENSQNINNSVNSAEINNTQLNSQTNQIPYPPQLPTSKPKSKLGLILIIITILLLICCVCTTTIIFVNREQIMNQLNNLNVTPTVDITPTQSTTPTPTISSITPTPTPKTTPTKSTDYSDDYNYDNGEEYPPMSNKFLDEIMNKKRKASVQNNFKIIDFGLGNPAYTISMLATADHYVEDYEKDSISIFTDSNALTQILITFDKTYLNYSCTDLSNNILKYVKNETYNFDSKKTVNLNGQNWERVIFKQTNGNKIVFNQCLKKEDQYIYYSLVTTNVTYNEPTNKDDIEDLLSDILVSENSLEY